MKWTQTITISHCHQLSFQPFVSPVYLSYCSITSLVLSNFTHLNISLDAAAGRQKFAIIHIYPHRLAPASNGRICASLRRGTSLLFTNALCIPMPSSIVAVFRNVPHRGATLAICHCTFYLTTRTLAISICTDRPWIALLKMKSFAWAVSDYAGSKLYYVAVYIIGMFTT